MSKYTLHYFGGNGRAAIIRALLSYGKEDFENHLVSQEEWPALKKSGLCEYEQLPVLEHDGKKCAQSIAIVLHLAEKYNILGKTPYDRYQCYNLLGSGEDLGGLTYAAATAPEDKKKNAMEAFLAKYTLYVEQYEKRYVANGAKKYFLGDEFSLADIYITVQLSKMCRVAGDKCPAKEKAPNLVKLMQRVKENELKVFFEKYFITTVPF